jgi:hypothetical protein
VAAVSLIHIGAFDLAAGETYDAITTVALTCTALIQCGAALLDGIGATRLSRKLLEYKQATSRSAPACPFSVGVRYTRSCRS